MVALNLNADQAALLTRILDRLEKWLLGSRPKDHY
jgi:hypothetical protein